MELNNDAFLLPLPLGSMEKKERSFAETISVRDRGW
jgi:hypothetical protein